MFKHNYLQKLAFDNIRKQKSFYRFIFISLVLVFALSSAISILFSSYDEIGYQERYRQYGLWSTMINQPTQEQIQLLSQKNKDLMIGNIYHIGYVEYQGQEVGTMDSLDQNSWYLMSFQLMEGRYPMNQKEMILNESQCLLLNIEPKVDQSITLTIHTEDQSIQQQYQIVGIIQNDYQKSLLNIGSFLTTQVTSTQNQALLYVQDNKDLWNQVIDAHFLENTVFNQETYNNYANVNWHNPHYYDSDLTIYMRYFIAILGFVGVLGTMVSSLSKRTEYLALMKAIGATSKQIQKLIVYEGLLLGVGAIVIGTILGFLMSFIVLLLYHLNFEGNFVYKVGTMFYVQMLISALTCLIGIFIPSFEAYFIPLTKRIHQNISHHRSKKIRKLNIFSLAFRELSQHKVISMALIAVVIIGIVSGVAVIDAIDIYRESMTELANDDTYDYKLSLHYNELNDKNIEKIKECEGITTQICYSQSYKMTWDSINEKNELIKYWQIDQLPMPYTVNVLLESFDDEKAMKELLSNHHLEGRYPKTQNEVLFIKPWMSFQDESYQISLIPDDKKAVNDYMGLEVGDKVHFLSSKVGDTNQEIQMNETFDIVGTISFEDLTKKEQQLFTKYDFQFIMSLSGYHHYFSQDLMAEMYFDLTDPIMMNRFKQTISEIVSQNESSDFMDYEEQMQKVVFNNLQMVFKMASFCGVLFVGIIVLTYLYRKVKILGSQDEIGLYRAIGATKWQIYCIHLLYAIIIYGLALLIIVLFIYVTLYAKNADVEEIMNSFEIKFLGYALVIGIGFILAVLLPVYSILKENILRTISRR